MYVCQCFTFSTQYAISSVICVSIFILVGVVLVKFCYLRRLSAKNFQNGKWFIIRRVHACDQTHLNTFITNTRFKFLYARSRIRLLKMSSVKRLNKNNKKKCTKKKSWRVVITDTNCECTHKTMQSKYFPLLCDFMENYSLNSRHTINFYKYIHMLTGE